MSSTLLIRQAEISDIKQIMKINKLCLPENYSFDFFYHILSNYGEACAVAIEEEEIIGYVLSRIEKTFVSLIGIPNFKGHIISIAVLPEFRRKNVGHKLMKFVMEKMINKGINTIYLEVRKSNYPAIELYKKLNYNLKRQIENYYRDGEAALIMEWKKQTAN